MTVCASPSGTSNDVGSGISVYQNRLELISTVTGDTREKDVPVAC